jgi:hypothetical protein
LNVMAAGSPAPARLAPLARRLRMALNGMGVAKPGLRK